MKKEEEGFSRTKEVIIMTTTCPCHNIIMQFLKVSKNCKVT